jgi:hypothetical protein
VIYAGIDDTDILGSPGTNQLARAIVRAAMPDWRCHGIVRHQLLFDRRIPYTSKNGSASIRLERRSTADNFSGATGCNATEREPNVRPDRAMPGSADIGIIIEICRRVMREWFIVGSDPGLCVTDHVPESITQYGWRCKEQIMTQVEAHQLAIREGLHLEGLGGTEGGVIGALAAVGLIVTGDDGRVVQHGEWPDDLTGPQPISELHSRDITVEEIDNSIIVKSGTVDVGKHLRPNLRAGRTKLFVQRLPDTERGEIYQAVKLT